MLKRLVLGAVAFGAVFIAERQLQTFYKDVNRYNEMRTMSGDPPFSTELVKMAWNVISQVAAGRQRGLRELLGSLTNDMTRYTAMRRM